MKATLLFVLSLFTVLFIGCINAKAQEFDYDEAIDGDLSDDFSNPSGPFYISPSSPSDPILITTTQTGNPRDIDYITLDASDVLIYQFILEDYDAEGNNNQAFLGLKIGTSFTTDAESTTLDDLDGALTYGSQDLGVDLLCEILETASDDSCPSSLDATFYTIWFNQTGATSTSTFRIEADTTASVDNNQLANDVQLFPNPVKDMLTVSSTTAIINNLAVYNLTGKLVLSEANPHTVSLQSLSAGVYFAQLTTDQGSVTKKIIKL